MRARITKLFAGLAAVAALAVGGSALASAGTTPTPAPAPAQAPVTAVDGDNVQQGDQTAPDTGAASEQSSTETSSESGAAGEVSANDGPGGHADEPANPNADHQFEGQE